MSEQSANPLIMQMPDPLGTIIQQEKPEPNLTSQTTIPEIKDVETILAETLKGKQESEDSKEEVILSRTLPREELYKVFCENMIAAGNVAEIIHTGTVEDALLGQSTIKWNGPTDYVCLVGYPFMRQRKEKILNQKLGEETVIAVPFLPDLGINLKILYYSPEHQGFMCVRGDVYNEA